jgi:uncharacterized protein (TIGR00730 family)
MPAMEQIGKFLALNNWRVVYGGSGKGVMGALIRGVESVAGGQSLGVLPEKIAALGFHRHDALIEFVEGMTERKRKFWDCDAFLCLPGGVGTMDELFEIWTLQKLKYEPRKPIVVFNWRGFYDPLRELLYNMESGGTMPMDRVDMVRFADQPSTAVSWLDQETITDGVLARREPREQTP